VLGDGVDGVQAEARGEPAVERRGRAATLDVTQHHGPRLGAGALLDLGGHPVADATQAHVPERVDVTRHQGHVAPLTRHRALGHDDDRRVLRLEARRDQVADLLDVERHLGDQDDVRAAGHPGVQRDPARVPPHHLDDQRAVVRLGGGVQAVDRLAGDVDRGVEAEGEVGAGQVVVDRLRYADDIDAEVGQPGRHAERVLAADRDQRVDRALGQVVLDPLDAALDRERVRAARAEDGPAAREDPPHLGDAELHGHTLEGTLPAVAEADELEPVDGDALAHHRADHRVQPRTVAAAGEDSDAHADS
jgi:hypothetical protein